MRNHHTAGGPPGAAKGPHRTSLIGFAPLDRQISALQPERSRRRTGCYQAISVAIRPCRFVLRRARRAHSCSRREMIGNCFSTVRGKSSRPGSASGRPTIHPVATVNATPSGRTYARLLVRWGFIDRNPISKRYAVRQDLTIGSTSTSGCAVTRAQSCTKWLSVLQSSQIERSNHSLQGDPATGGTSPPARPEEA